MSNIRPYTICVPMRCHQLGPLDKQVFFLCCTDASTGKRYARWNGCDSMSGSAECTECRQRMVKEFLQAHPDYSEVL